MPQIGNKKMDMRETCILETCRGEKLLFFRLTHQFGYAAQVHDGENLLAEMIPDYGKRGRNFRVIHYSAWKHETQSRDTVKTTFHGKRESALRSMERNAIKLYRDRHFL
jgi:hypothetical protein